MWPAGHSVWAVPCQTAEATYTLRADCSTCISDQTGSTLFPPLGASVQSSSPHESVSSSHGTAISISPKRTGRNRGLRYHSASQNKLASSIQGNLSFNSFKYKQSPEKVWATQRQAQAVARGTVATRLHIGASLLGKCIGVCPFPGAQAEALETLLQQQNPANWEAGLARHKQIAMEQQVQQLARTCCPDLQQPLHQLLQVTALEVLPEPKPQHEAAVQACLDACKERLADQAATVELHARIEADLVAAAAAAAAATAVAAAAATTVAAAANAAEESGATEPSAGDGHVDYAEMLALAPRGCMSPESVFAAAKVAEVIEGIQAASHTTEPAPDATAEGSQPEAAATAMASAETAMTDADADLSSADALETVEPEELNELHHVDRSLSDGSVDLLTDAQSSEEEEAGNAPEQLQLFTTADMQLVLDYVQECSNSAYGRQAEHAMIQQFDREAQQAQHAQQGNHTWHKMGAPDHQELGVHKGISFELGCQVDRALCDPRSGKPIPVEFKNRVNRFPARVREHERVQVQAQLQLCNAPMGVLVERLQLPDGSFQCQWHDIVRDDWQWHDEVMPALYKFMAVVARLATEQDELELYLRKRVLNQHRSYLKDLLRQQAAC